MSSLGGTAAANPPGGGGGGAANLGRHLRNLFRRGGNSGKISLGKTVKAKGKAKAPIENIDINAGRGRLGLETVADVVTLAAVAVLPATGVSALQLAPSTIPVAFREGGRSLATGWAESARGANGTATLVSTSSASLPLAHTQAARKAPAAPRSASGLSLPSPTPAQPSSQPTTSLTPTGLHLSDLPALEPCSDAATGLGVWPLTPSPDVQSRFVYLDDLPLVCTPASTAARTTAPTAAPTASLAETPAPPPPIALFDWRRIQLLKLLGSGSFGHVQQARLMGTKGQRDLYVAVKVPKEGMAGAEALLLKEARLMAHLRHPNLLRVYGLTRNPVGLVTELLPAGTLGAALEKRNGVPVSVAVRHTVARGVAAALQHLHAQSPPIVHRDLSSANVLLAKGWQPRVCDFGLSRRKVASALAASAAGDGTPAYMAPEVLSSGRVTEKADVYSFGVLLWELVSGRSPWDGLTSFQVIYQVCMAGARLEPPDGCPVPLAELMRACFEADPIKRPCFTSILRQLDAAAPQPASA